MTVVEMTSISKSYDGTRILDEVSLDVLEGERLVIFGPSGCGKTTMLRLIAGFVAPDTGRLAVAGKTVSRDGRILIPPERRRIGMVFQDLALWPHMTVKENIEFGLKVLGHPREARGRAVRGALELVGMTDYEDRRPSTLSGGQQQRVAIARALVLEPRVLLMDEPLSSLDRALNERLRREILRLQGRLGFTMIYVTHDRNEALNMATRVAVMKEGRIVEEGCGW